MSYTVELSNGVLEEIYNQGIEEYPAECCGWIIENSDGSKSYFRTQNLQDKYHNVDPEAYPRTSKDAFLIDTLKLTRAIDEAEANGGRLYSIVHSHIDCGAYFSEEDRHQMALPDGSDQVFASYSYLVVSIDNRQPGEKAAFVYDREKKDFIDAEIVIV